MRGRCLALVFAVVSAIWPKTMEAQWRDPRLIAGQVAFNITASFLGKLLLNHHPPRRALREAIIEGAASGAVAHTGYCIVGKHPHLTLVGKTLAQKSNMMTRRSMKGEPVFDRYLYNQWQLTHSVLFIQLGSSPRVEIDVVNSAASTYFLFSDDLRLDPWRSLYTGSLFFRNERAPRHIRGFFAPGAIWVDESVYDSQVVLSHELLHSLQAERGAAIADWHYKNLRFNLLVFASGVPALLKGWPDHKKRLHEQEVDLYAGRKQCSPR